MEDNAENRMTRDQMRVLWLALIETLRDPAATPEHTRTDCRLYRITPESRAVLDFFDKDIDFTEVYICAGCLEIRGTWKSHGEVFRQGCLCEGGKPFEPDETWFGFDINKLCELCRCCASELVESGFQSSIWFCRECKQRVDRVNDKHGGRVVPMGPFLPANQNETVATLDSWMGMMVRENLRARGFSETDDIPLGRYLEALAERPVDKSGIFDQLCAFRAGSLRGSG
jgi:hypothetical protein